MQKKHSPQNSLYWYILTEGEWYGQTQDTRNEIVADCEREARECGARYANIICNPDPVLSISPYPTSHHVWKWAAPTAREIAADGAEVLDYWRQRALAAEAKLRLYEDDGK